jgi:hypothetical protein
LGWIAGKPDNCGRFFAINSSVQGRTILVVVLWLACRPVPASKIKKKSDDFRCLTIGVVPDSGSDELAGLAGTMQIKIEDGQHLYEFTYTLP